VTRRLSQEELAHRAEISTRHLSCLETGRAQPSHAMLLLLGSAMDLPLRLRNNLLVAAGFAPVYRTSPFDDPAMAHVQQAVNHILRLHEPHPAMLLDRSWNVLQMNEGAARLFAWCGMRFASDGPTNALRALFDASYGLRESVANFDALADEVLARLRTEAQVDPSLEDLLGVLVDLRGKHAPTREEGAAALVALPIHLRRAGVELRYFTTLTTLGTPLDVTAQELRIEGYFPLDGETDAFGKRLASEAGTASNA
jgi:transcriptional regulator with XRE-family HTH domain